MLLWATDTHFNFLQRAGTPAKAFGECLAKENPTATGLIVTGDISTAPLVAEHLNELAKGFPHPVYFVLGNHDYYGGSFTKVDAKVQKVVQGSPRLHWLNNGWHLHEGMAVVGVNGWYDAYYGNANTKVDISDFYDIQDLAPGCRMRDLLLQLVRDRAGQEADRLAALLKEACASDTDLIVVGTHVAPYAEAAWYNGKPSDRDWVPWFSSASTGAVLDTYADKFPGKTFLVLCGHSHSPGVYQRRDNMTVYTGKAQYYTPDLSGAIIPAEKKLWAYDANCRKVERPIPLRT